MATLLNAYLNFDRQAREAMEFYADVLGGELSIMTFGDMGMDDPAVRDSVMHSSLETAGGMTLMASDMPPGMDWKAGTNFALSLSGEDAAALRGYWERLTEGGEVQMPLEAQMWGDEMGACVDRFGVGWMININAPRGD